MASRRSEAPAPPAPDFAVTHPLRPGTLAAVLSVILFSISAMATFVVFRPVAPPGRLIPLTGFAVVFIASWAIFAGVMVMRRPEPVEAVRLWGRIAQFVLFGAHAACVWLVWAILPYGAPPQQLMVIVFLVAYVPTQIICSPENTLATRVGIVAVLGSTVAFLAMRGGELDTLLAIYIVAFGCVMFALSDVVNRTVRETVAARMASDHAALELERLLATVAAERDAKTRFIATASHDLGQPLQAAGLFFDQALRARDEGARAKAEDGVRRAFASADQLLSHMLNHLRLEADAVQPYPSRVPLAPLFSRITAQYTPAAKEAGITVRPALTRRTLMVDPVLLERALGNLVNNAIQHSAGSRVLLAARRHDAGTIGLWVIDDGVGVGRIDAKHIFDDYYRGVGSRNGEKGGFGLGLSSVRRIARLLGGEAGLDQRWRNGAAFYLQLPDPGPPRR
jgi:signal transduction histidine kinase